ncbi:MAG: BPSL0067 family protein [Bosea sp. (in: a-proteobacteria)]
MPYVYSKVDDLDGTEKVGSKQCVALLQHYGKLPQTSKWNAGATVFGDQNIQKGTAIATFVDGKYKSLPTGNHAAFYVSQDTKGVWIMDQWSSDAAKPKVSMRHIKPKGSNSGGTFIDPSNNADAYSIIE